MDGLDRLFLKLEARDQLSHDERQALRDAVEGVEVFEPGQDIARENEDQTVSRLLVEGISARAKSLASGGRQITELHIPGDFVDLHSFLLKRLDHDVVALTQVRMANVPHANLRRITDTHPHLTRMLWLNTLLDAAEHREWLVSAGRRSSLEQVAHLFAEMMVRQELVGLADGRTCPLPLTQQQLGDVCGLSTVHINRVVQELRREGLVEWRDGILTIFDAERLKARAAFDPAYLFLRREPR